MTRRKSSYDMNPDLELKLEVRRPIPVRQMKSPPSEVVMPSASPPSSCVSVDESGLRNSVKRSDERSMVLVGCQQCLMYVMLSDDRLRCPKCESTAVLLIDAAKDHAFNGTTRSRRSLYDLSL